MWLYLNSYLSVVILPKLTCVIQSPGLTQNSSKTPPLPPARYIVIFELSIFPTPQVIESIKEPYLTATYLIESYKEKLLPVSITPPVSQVKLPAYSSVASY